MQQASTKSEPVSLPLFRAEAMAARQQNAQGEILLIRPFSLAFLCWLGVAVAAITLGFLFFGHATQTIRIEGTITSSAHLQAIFRVPESQIHSLKPGRGLTVQCAGCSHPLAGKIISISKASAEGNSGPTGPESIVTVALPSQEQLQPGARVEAQVQLGRKTLLAWLMEKPGP